MGRYSFLLKDDVYSSLNKVRDALLAAKDGNDVEEIMNGIFTFDERIKIGRRIQIAECLLGDMKIEDIQSLMKVGRSTIAHVSRNILEYEKCFHLIRARSKKLEKEYETKKYRKVGGSKLVFKKKVYTGITRKDIER